MEYYVSLYGNDNNSGELLTPFRTIKKGIKALRKGDVLTIRKGTYVECIDIRGKKGEENESIVIRGFPGESVYIDGSFTEFRNTSFTISLPGFPEVYTVWEPAILHDQEAHPEEYVSVMTVPENSRDGIRGAFLVKKPYTRLINYSNINDLRTTNETFTKIQDPNILSGPIVTDARGNPKGYRFPWVYMGPGLWLNKETRKIHIRLSHTNNRITGLADYRGETDPRKVKLAISPKPMKTLYARGSNYVKFENLHIRYGGEYTIHLENNTGLIFDHVHIWASGYGVRMGKCSKTIFRHCEFNGGMPTWFFRSDRKSEYYYQNSGEIKQNNLGKQTQRSLFLGSNKDDGTEVHNCEFVNGHDLYLAGARIKFHHNWINNLNDDCLFIKESAEGSGWIYQNIIINSLMAINVSVKPVDPGGPWYIYRNLMDLRGSTASYRPRIVGDSNVWRFGIFYKSDPPDAPMNLFQNTFLIYASNGQATFNHYRNTKTRDFRRCFNNIFISVNPGNEYDRAIAFIPSPGFNGPTDGNNYFRMIYATRNPYRYLEYAFDGENYGGGSFTSLEDMKASLLFEQSKTRYSLGYEANSIETNPEFRKMKANGKPHNSDDFRLKPQSPAIGAGIILPPDLLALDTFATSDERPAIGCFSKGSSPLKTGVDGLKSHPH